MRPAAAACILFGLVLTTSPGSRAVAEEAALVRPEILHGALSLSSEVGGDGSIRGLLRNQGSKHISEIRLLIHHSWLWNDERNPGPPEVNPSRAQYYRVEGEIAPGGELRFYYKPDPPLPERSDGRFATRSEIIGFTERTAE